MKMATIKLFFLLGHLYLSSSQSAPPLPASTPPPANAILKNSSCLVPQTFQTFDNSSMVCVRLDGGKKLKDAITECQKIYAYPACIISEAMLKAVGDLSLVQNYNTFMSGASINNQTGQWVCSNGHVITSNDVVHWGSSEPSNGADEKCMQFVKQGTNYGIADASCNSEGPYMCEFSVTCDRMKPNEFYTVGNYSYCFNNVLTTYAGAASICNSIGAQLACPRDSNVVALFQNVAIARGMPNVYVGLTDHSLEGTFNCWDGSIPVINDWLSGEPNGNTYENCVSLAKSVGYKLADYLCDRPHYSICEIPYSGF